MARPNPDVEQLLVYRLSPSQRHASAAVNLSRSSVRDSRRSVGSASGSGSGAVWLRSPQTGPTDDRTAVRTAVYRSRPRPGREEHHPSSIQFERIPSGTGSERMEKPDHLFDVTLSLHPTRRGCGFRIQILKHQAHEIRR